MLGEQRQGVLDLAHIIHTHTLTHLQGSLRNHASGAQEEEKEGRRKPAVACMLLYLATLLQGRCPESQAAAMLPFRVHVLLCVLLPAQVRESQCDVVRKGYGMGHRHSFIFQCGRVWKSQSVESSILYS